MVVIMVVLKMHNNLVSDSSQEQQLATEVARMLVKKSLTLATAESCTGGAIGALLTSLAGSSAWFNGGVISYSNASKIKLLNVNPDAIDTCGAVSQAVVEAMAIGGCQALGADLCVAVSGVAGPGGGTSAKPVGSVWIAWCGPEQRLTSGLYHFDGERTQIQRAAVRMALQGVINQC
jgi:nicotinamide-nucleotide amidase